MGPCEASPLLRNSGLAVPSDRPSPTKTPGLSDAGVVDLDIEFPAHCTSGVMGFEQIELFNAQTG